MRWIGFLAAITLVIACFCPWVYIESKNIIVSGIQSAGTSFGKPGYFHILLAVFFITFNFIPKVWAKRSNLLVTALNIAWAVRNYFLISACLGGDCPDKKPAIYILLLASLIMLISALFPGIKLSDERK